MTTLSLTLWERRVEQTRISTKEQGTRCASECQKRDTCRARHLQALLCLSHFVKRPTLQHLFRPSLLCAGIPYTAPEDCSFSMCIFIKPNSLCFWHTLSFTLNYNNRQLLDYMLQYNLPIHSCKARATMLAFRLVYMYMLKSDL